MSTNLNARLKADIDKVRSELEAFKADNCPTFMNSFDREQYDYFFKRHTEKVAFAENRYAQAVELAELAETLPPFRGLKLTDKGLVFANGSIVASPLFVYQRTSATNLGWCVDVAYLTPDNCWLLERVPMQELNDHGARLRARLLKRGVNVAVDTDYRKSLLNFILNSEAMKTGGAQ